MSTDIKHLCFCGKTKELESIRKKRGQKTEAALFQTNLNLFWNVFL